MSALHWTILFSLIAAGATVAGGLAVTLPGRLSRNRLNHGIAFGAGYMLAAAFVSMMPEAVERVGQAPLWILAGYVLAHLFEHTFTPHFHFGEETHAEHHAHAVVGLTALVGLALHAFFDGVAISSGFLVTPALGIFIALAVILHKIPEGVTIASVMLASGATKRRALDSTLILAAATLAGAALMSRLHAIAGPALAVSCGIAVYVAATDLIPEFNQQKEKRFSASALLGLVLYFGLHRLLTLLGLH